MEEILKNLIRENFRCVTQMFEYGALPYDEEKEADGVAPVVSDRFKTLADLENYVYGIYAPETARKLIADTYFDKDGALHLYVQRVPGAGYYAKWEEYTISHMVQEENRCSFCITMPLYTDEGEEPEDKTCACAAVNDGQWKLTELVC